VTVSARPAQHDLRRHDLRPMWRGILAAIEEKAGVRPLGVTIGQDEREDWALDRFSREGMVPTIQHLDRLNSYGVMFHSYTESHLCADNEMVRGILLAVLATMAKQEAKRLSERVICGHAQGRCEGHQDPSSTVRFLK
jgi:hypothetical protein